MGSKSLVTGKLVIDSGLFIVSGFLFLVSCSVCVRPRTASPDSYRGRSLNHMNTVVHGSWFLVPGSVCYKCGLAFAVLITFQFRRIKVAHKLSKLFAN